MTTFTAPVSLLSVLRVAALLLFVVLPVEPGEEEVDIAPVEGQGRTAGRIASRLQQSHYRPLSIDDDFSDDLLDRYLAFLDPNRLFLLQSDIDEVQAYRAELDDALMKGDMGPTYDIFNRFQERHVKRLEDLVARLEAGIDDVDLQTDAMLQLDRREADWPRSEQEADELWDKRFTNDVLELELTDRDPEEIVEILGRRYENRLHRGRQITSADVFRVYMNAITAGYDPHTQYFPPREAENFDIQMSLSLEGIGALLGSDGEYTEIVRIIAAGPAERGGELSAGDRIVAVGQGREEDLVDVVGWRVDEVVDLIRGPRGTIVRLEILPNHRSDRTATNVVEIERDEVKLEEQAASRRTVEIERDGRAYSIGVIELTAFYMDFEAARSGDPDYKSSTRDVERLVAELKSEEVDGIVLDLRHNGGGSLVEARELSSLFMGRKPVVQIRGPGGDKSQIEVVGGVTDAAWDGPLAVLVNRLSASASEIFAGAIQDTGRGLVIGSRTFGKGTVQSVTPLADGQLKLTQAMFFRISGASTQSRGILPDVLLPPMYDHEQIGESALDEALPWEEIRAVQHERQSLVADQRETLQKQHAQRLVGDPELIQIVEQLGFYDELRQRTRVSLDRDLRRAQRDADEGRLLAIENRRRVAEGREELASFDDEADEGAEGAGEDAEGGGEDAEIADDESDEPEAVDPLAREAAAVLVDLIGLSGEG